MAKRITPSTLPLTWVRLTAYLSELLAVARSQPEAINGFCIDLGVFLDTLAEQDAFGTEGQCDPRGDQRG